MERLLKRGDEIVRLGDRAFDILAALADRPGELVGRNELIDKVWSDVFVGEASLRFHISQLRKALGDGGDGDRYIRNVTGRGYTLVAPATRLVVEGPPEQDRPTYALPRASERMVGRDEVVRELSQKLLSERFVSIVGPGGVGKTTVALSIANSLLQDFAGAVCFVTLSSVGDPGLLAATVTAALGVPVQSDDPLPELIEHLRGRELLLVLDNCEHLIGKAAEVAQRLFESLDRLYVLTTGREALQVEGEQVFRLPPLASPPEGQPLSPAQALAYPSARLFANHMANAGTGGALSIEETATIGRMCRQLGGLPLAIELAASRAALVGIHDTEDQLNSLFALRWPGRRTAPPRQQTLNATLDWSYNLLSGSEQAVLRRLSCFSGAFTLDAAQAVALLGDDIGKAELLDAVGSLVAKSLLSTDRSEPLLRYRMLETCRNYAMQKLDEAAEREPTKRRHALYYCELLKSASAEETAADMPTASVVDLEDIRAALQWAFGEGGDKLLGAEIGGYSAPLWLGRALLAEGRAWMAKAAEASIEGATIQQQLRIQIAFASTELFTRGFADTTIAAWEKTLERATALNDVPALLLSYLALWAGEIRAAQYAQALVTAEKCAALVRDSADPGSQAMGEWMLGCSKHCTAAFGESRDHLERYLILDTEVARLAMIKATGYDRLVDALGVLSNTLCIMGLPDQARAMGKRAVAEAGSLGFAIPIGAAMSCAILTTYLSEPHLGVLEDDAVELLEHATTHSIDGDAGFALCLLGLSQAQREDFEAGARLVSRGLGMLESARMTTFSILVLAHICEVSLQAGRGEDAIAWMEQLMSADRNEDHWCSCEVFRVQGLLAQSQGDEGAAAELMLRGVALARRQGALSWELRSTMSLSRLWAGQGQTAQALGPLLAVYEQYTEGFGTRDLIQAETLIEALR